MPAHHVDSGQRQAYPAICCFPLPHHDLACPSATNNISALFTAAQHVIPPSAPLLQHIKYHMGAAEALGLCMRQIGIYADAVATLLCVLPFVDDLDDASIGYTNASDIHILSVKGHLQRGHLHSILKLQIDV